MEVGFLEQLASMGFALSYVVKSLILIEGIVKLLVAESNRPVLHLD